MMRTADGQEIVKVERVRIGTLQVVDMEIGGLRATYVLTEDVGLYHSATPTVSFEDGFTGVAPGGSAVEAGLHYASPES